MCGQSFHNIRQDFLLDLDVATGAEKDFDQYEIIRPLRLYIGKCWVVLEVWFIQLKHSMESILWIDSGIHQGSVNRIEYLGPEFLGLWPTDRDRDDWHSVIMNQMMKAARVCVAQLDIDHCPAE